jgi:hypothetical protein
MGTTGRPQMGTSENTKANGCLAQTNKLSCRLLTKHHSALRWKPRRKRRANYWTVCQTKGRERCAMTKDDKRQHKWLLVVAKYAVESQTAVTSPLFCEVQ